MVIKRHRGLSGQIEIRYDYRENANGDREDTHQIELLTEDNKIILSELEETIKFIGGSSNKKESKFEIDPKELIRFIKDHGKEI